MVVVLPNVSNDNIRTVLMAYANHVYARCISIYSMNNKSINLRFIFFLSLSLLYLSQYLNSDIWKKYSRVDQVKFVEDGL